MKNKLLVFCVILFITSEFMVVLPRSMGYPSLLISLSNILASVIFLLYLFGTTKIMKNVPTFLSILLCIAFFVFVIFRREAFMLFDISIHGIIGVFLFVSIWIFFSFGSFIYMKTRTSFLLFVLILIISALEVSVYMFYNESNMRSIFLMSYMVLFATSNYYISLFNVTLTGLVTALIIIISKKVCYSISTNTQNSYDNIGDGNN